MKSCFKLASIAASLAAFSLPVLAADPHDQSGVPLEQDSPDPKLAKIVLLAGAPSSKPMAHEYFAGCALLQNWLKQQPGVWPVLARDWPQHEAVLKGARAIVYYGDGGGKQPFLNGGHWAAFSKMMDSGAGLVLLHQAVDFQADANAVKIKGWLGGVFHGDIGCRGHWDMDLKPMGKHPVLNGVSSFSAPGDGWLYNLHFADQGFTPLLVGAVPDKSRTTADAKAHTGRDEVIAWAFQRPGGGRGFAFTGADLHKSWGYDSQRKLVINGILWSARVEVPPDGAKVDFNPADLNRNLDNKRAQTGTAPARPTTKKP